MKLPELFQTTYQKVVEWFFRPVLVLQIVALLDEIENSLVISLAALD